MAETRPPKELKKAQREQEKMEKRERKRTIKRKVTPGDISVHVQK